MSRESTCRCLVCALERSLKIGLAESDAQERYREFADSHSLLSAFPFAADLVAHLHTCRSSGNGAHSADSILGELLRAAAGNGALRELLLLAFTPALHSTVRRVAVRYPSLSSDDIAQHAVASLLQMFGSSELSGRSSHVAFHVSRILKRAAFTWAERECRSPVNGAVREMFPELPSTYDTSEPIERAAFLRHFLDRCHARGVLTTQDLQLLVHSKLDADRDTKPGGPAEVYSNATRQRMKRLLGKLRRIARTPPGPKQDDPQLRLF